MDDGAFIVHLKVRNRGDRLSAISAEVPGLHLYGRDEFEIRDAALRAVKDLFKRNRNMDVSVSPMDDLSQVRVRPIPAPC